MEQNCAENTSNQQQNVHLHMHHMCSCQGNVYSTYYPAVGYRGPVPSLLTYGPPPVPRPYLHHYQYTQYNMGNQYSVPINHVPHTGPIYGTSVTSTDVLFNSVSRERKAAGSQDENSEVERLNEISNGEFTQVTPPASEFFLTENFEATPSENFVRFLERSCLIAEQIAYRNRNRPCFRNIQNLCIRTRSEILKSCTTISNIHSQGIPWATKDFIYAFVRLTNCWHILKGYWENRDGSCLGKIEKELTPEFRACYVRWEKETMELAAQLTKVFYNLDTNLVTPQVEVINTPPTTECVINNVSTVENVTTSTLTNISINNCHTKNMRGLIHLATTPATETVDQANQTYAGDFCTVREEGFDSEEERRVYMKPGSYNVPKRDSKDGGNMIIEFLDTAQNIDRAQAGNDRYWGNVNVTKKTGDPKPSQHKTTNTEVEPLNLSSHLNVHEWLLSSNFSDFGEPSPVSTSTNDIRPFFVDTSSLYESLPQTDSDHKKSSVKVLQRGRPAVRNKKESNVVGIPTEGPSKTFTKRPKRNMGIYENEDGITDTGVAVLEDLLIELRKYDVLEGLDDSDKHCYAPIIDLDVIVNKLKGDKYTFVNEVIRDLKYLINYFKSFADNFANVDGKKKELVTFITEMFSLKLRHFLREHFPGTDFSDIKGDVLQVVGQLKINALINNSTNEV